MAAGARGDKKKEEKKTPEKQKEVPRARGKGRGEGARTPQLPQRPHGGGRSEGKVVKINNGLSIVPHLPCATSEAPTWREFRCSGVGGRQPLRHTRHLEPTRARCSGVGGRQPLRHTRHSEPTRARVRGGHQAARRASTCAASGFEAGIRMK
ncbi:hypothetical protein NDU88_004603 [Pleurodeles waltl]|uniref:Uncharacterized protein n=1 Tax=Pleurodeles waltl TaxID=8319 RepID=A0AAV7T8Z0_PLEWA|nr:hypothetical protein NDU88_004603 [Pleurodeles waltl]